jgi:HAE1 family hydrophobic/amphiphilic exporter-1
VVIQDGPAMITERDGERNSIVTADIVGNDTMKVINDVKERLDKLKSSLPDSVDVFVGGTSDMIQEGFTQMGMAMLTAILLVFITMLLGLKEPSAALSILFSLPFAAVGALLSLVGTKHPVSMSGLVGILMLIGIVVTNAIVLMDRVLTNKANGMSVSDALIEAGSVRIRPILMTAAATVMALMPMALGFSHSAFIGQEVGVVVIGGLVMSTILTLVIVPVTYSIMTQSGKAKDRSNTITG